MDQHSSLLGEILKIPGAQDAMFQALDGEAVGLVEQLRTAAIVGDPIKSALIEGKLQTLDEVIGILIRFAEEAKSHKVVNAEMPPLFEIR